MGKNNRYSFFTKVFEWGYKLVLVAGFLLETGFIGNQELEVTGNYLILVGIVLFVAFGWIEGMLRIKGTIAIILATVLLEFAFSLCIIKTDALSYASMPNWEITVINFAITLLFLIFLLSCKSGKDNRKKVFLTWSSIYLIVCGFIYWVCELLVSTVVFVIKTNTFDGIRPIEFAGLLLYLMAAFFVAFVFAVRDQEIEAKVLPLQAAFGLGLIAIVFSINQLVKWIISAELSEEKMLAVVGCIIFAVAVIVFSAIKSRKFVLQKNNKIVISANEKSGVIQYESYKKNMILNAWKHDFNNHLTVLKALAEKEDLDGIKNYLGAQDNLVSDSEMINSGNSLLDTVFALKIRETKSEGIKLDYLLCIPEEVPFSDADFTSLIGNLLDNAIEAVKRVPDERRIYFEIKVVNRYLRIFVFNTCMGEYNLDINNNLLSTKSEPGHGLGLSQIKYLVESYEGIIRITPEKEKFEVVIMVPIL